MNVSRQQLLEQIRDYLQKERGIDPSSVEEGARFREDLDLDSLDLAGMAVELEGAFDMQLDDDHVLRITTVGEAIDAVLERVAARGEGSAPAIPATSE